MLPEVPFTLEPPGPEETRAERQARKARAASASWRKRNPDKVKEANKRAYQEHREDRIAGVRRWKNLNVERERNREKMRTLRKSRMIESAAPRPRPEVCDICGQRETATTKRGAARKLALDHCHATGKFRGWLCARCNMMLGKVNDDSALLIKMAQYLKQGGAPF